MFVGFNLIYLYSTVWEIFFLGAAIIILVTNVCDYRTVSQYYDCYLIVLNVYFCIFLFIYFFSRSFITFNILEKWKNSCYVLHEIVHQFLRCPQKSFTNMWKFWNILYIKLVSQKRSMATLVFRTIIRRKMTSSIRNSNSNYIRNTL